MEYIGWFGLFIFFLLLTICTPYGIYIFFVRLLIPLLNEYFHEKTGGLRRKQLSSEVNGFDWWRFIFFDSLLFGFCIVFIYVIIPALFDFIATMFEELFGFNYFEIF